MFNLQKKIGLKTLILLFCSLGILYAAQAQRVDIFQLMERRDLRLTEIDAIAKRHFDIVGRGRGTGYKQFERWKYEKQFHLDANGFILSDNYDAIQYSKLSGRMANADQGINNAVAGAWTELGPTGWNRTSGWNPGVGRVTSISVYPSNQNIIYLTSPGGGVWKSTTGGNSWTALSDYNNSMMTMFSVAVDPTNPDIVFAGNSGGNIFKSTDGGSTWASKSSGMGSVRKILINPNNPLIMYATGSGLYKSTDGGNTWVRKSTVGTEDIEFKPGNTDVLYACGSNVYRSFDAGETWTQLGAGNGISFSARCMIGVSAADSNVVYIIQANGSEFGRMYRSNDGGNSFSITITGSSASCTNFFGYSTNGCGTGGQATYDMAICVNPLNVNEVHIAGIICWKSIDGGNSFVAETAWSLPNTIGYNHADVHVLEWVGSTIYSGSDGGIYKSTDFGDNWTDLSNGMGTRQFYRIANSKLSRRIVTGGAQDNGSSVLKYSGWLDWLGADGMDGLTSPLDSNLLWGTSQNGSLYRSTNGGSSYSNITSPATGNWVTPLAIQANSNVIYSGYAGVYRSTDNGTTWTKISGTVINTNLNVLAVAPSDPNYIYASTGPDIYVTKDGGTTWTSRSLSGISITSFAIHPSNPEKIWISSSNSTNRLMVSGDAGATFTNISSNLPSLAARSVVVDNTADEGLYAGMNVGVYYTNKNMTSWINLTDNLPQVAINEVELQLSGGKIRAATYGRGLWERDLYNPCTAPSGPQTGSVTDTSASVSWTASASATSYNVDYKQSSSTTWINAVSNTAGTSYDLTGLIRGTSYDWRVNSNCSSGTSTYVSASFATTIPCGTPQSLTADNLTLTGAKLNWALVTDAMSYSVSYKASSSSTWILASDTITQPYYFLDGLNQGTTYNWNVTATCLAGTGDAAAAQFTTPILCNAPSNLNTSSITSTSGSLSWNAVSGASGYDVDFKLSSSSTWTNKATGLTSLTYSLTGLTAGTAYDWRVRSNCGILSGYSGYSSSSFTTATPPCTDSYESNNTSTTSKAITLGTAINASIGTSTDVDWFKFTTPNSTASNVRISLYNLPANYDVFLYNKNLALLGSGTSLLNTAETIIYNTTAQKQTYYVKVVGVGGAFSSSQCYSLKAESGSSPFRITPTAPEMTQSLLPEYSSSRMEIFPTPAREELNVVYFAGEPGQATLLLTDIEGKTLQQKAVTLHQGRNNLKLNLKEYAAGTYMLRFEGEKKVLTEKFVKER